VNGGILSLKKDRGTTVRRRQEICGERCVFEKQEPKAGISMLLLRKNILGGEIGGSLVSLTTNSLETVDLTPGLKRVGMMCTDFPTHVDAQVIVRRLESPRSSWYAGLGCLSRRVRGRPTRRD